MTIRTDYSRLHEEMPDRQCNREERNARRNLMKLFNDVKKEDYEWPKTAQIDADAKWFLAKELDDSALRVYNNVVKKIQNTPEHAANYREMREAPKNCGGFKLEKCIMNEATPFEQMIALDQVIYNHSEKLAEREENLQFKKWR